MKIISEHTDGALILEYTKEEGSRPLEDFYTQIQECLAQSNFNIKDFSFYNNANKQIVLKRNTYLHEGTRYTCGMGGPRG